MILQDQRSPLLLSVYYIICRLRYQELLGVVFSRLPWLSVFELTSRTLYTGRKKYGGWLSSQKNSYDIDLWWSSVFQKALVLNIWVIWWSVVFQKALLWYFPVINRAQGRLLLVSNQWLLCHLSVWASFGFPSNLTTIPNSLWDTKFAKDGVDGRKT